MAESKETKRKILTGPPTKEELMASNLFENNTLPKDLIGISDSMMEGLYAHAYRTYNAGKYRDAAELFRLLVMLNAFEPKYVLGLAACHHLRGQYDNALITYTIVETLNPKDPMPNYHSADCFLQLQLLEPALEQMQTALTKCGDLPQYAALKNKIIVTISALVKQVSDLKTEGPAVAEKKSKK